MKKKYYIPLIAYLIMFAAIMLLFTIPVGKNFRNGADEMYYYSFSKLFAEKGVSCFPELIKSYTSNTEARLYPTPSRVGFILLGGIWFKIFGVSFTNLALFSLFCYFLFLIFSFFYSRKIFGKEFSYLFTLLLSSSPLIMAMGRRALTESCINLFWALSLWTFMFFILRNKRRHFVIFIFVYSFAILVKESALFLLPFFIAYYFIAKYGYKIQISVSYLAGTIFLPLTLVALSWFSLFGGWDNMRMLVGGLFDAHFGSVEASHYAVSYCMGPWFKYLMDFLLVSPVTTLLCFGYFSYVILTRRNDWREIYFMTFAGIIYFILSSLKYSKVLRFAITLEMVVCLFSVLFFLKLFENLKRSETFVFWACVGVFFMNLFTFYIVFYVKDVYDPISFHLLTVFKIIP